MKKIFICLIFFLVGCSKESNENQAPSRFKELGSLSSTQIWVYLCGLTSDLIPEQMDDLKTLDAIGKQLNIKFLVVIPQSRCPQYNNRLCWPHDNEQEILQTYQEITSTIHGDKIQGYIGFSNGGFFLNKLAQFVEIREPIIAIGAASPLFNKDGPKNTIYLLIGKKDEWHYKHAINFYNQSKDTPLKINLIEYDEGHKIPITILSNLLKDLHTKK